MEWIWFALVCWLAQNDYITKFSKIHCRAFLKCHYIDVIMTTMASQITILTVVYWIVYSGVDQRKHQSSASLAFVNYAVCIRQETCERRVFRYLCCRSICMPLKVLYYCNLVTLIYNVCDAVSHVNRQLEKKFALNRIVQMQIEQNWLPRFINVFPNAVLV